MNRLRKQENKKIIYRLYTKIKRKIIVKKKHKFNNKNIKRMYE